MGAKGDAPVSFRVRGRPKVLPPKGDADLLARLGPAPDRNGLAALKNGPVLEEAKGKHIRMQKGQGCGEKQNDSEPTGFF